jgi:hypothetical protein
MIQNEHSTTDEPPPNLTVGGSKGHEVETINGNLLLLYLSCRWKPIPRCTGRYTCRDHDLSRIHPLMLAQTFAAAPSGEGSDDAGHIGNDASASRRRIWEFTLPGRDDAILIVPLDPSNRTGIISYKKESPERGGVNDRDRSSCRSPLHEASYVHTLNAPSGFRRKLQAMGLTVIDDNIMFEAGRDST